VSYLELKRLKVKKMFKRKHETENSDEENYQPKNAKSEREKTQEKRLSDHFDSCVTISSQESLDSSQGSETMDYFKIIKTELNTIVPEGDSTCGGPCDSSLSNPQLFIKKYGLVELPIREEAGEKIIKICNQAPYGKGTETVVDKKVRDTFQLDPDDFQINDPKWEDNLKHLVEKVATEIGCDDKYIEAKLYKLLIYKTNGHFKPHRDTEKEKNMLATLSIQLPSIYTGGELIVHLDDKKATQYHFCEKNNNEIDPKKISHYTCHYADLLHEVKRVTSGFRTVLVYSLCSTGNSETIANETVVKTDKLQIGLEKLSQTNSIVGFLLEHKYTDKSFKESGVQALKTIDRGRFNRLKSANDALNEEKQFEFYIACVSMEKSEYDVSGHYEEDSSDSSFEYSRPDSENDDDSSDSSCKRGAPGSFSHCEWETNEETEPKITKL
jgi:hypothetical protein